MPTVPLFSPGFLNFYHVDIFLEIFMLKWEYSWAISLWVCQKIGFLRSSQARDGCVGLTSRHSFTLVSPCCSVLWPLPLIWCNCVVLLHVWHPRSAGGRPLCSLAWSVSPCRVCSFLMSFMGSVLDKSFSAERLNLSFLCVFMFSTV